MNKGTVSVKIVKSFGVGLSVEFGYATLAEFESPSDLSKIERSIETLLLGQVERFQVEHLDMVLGAGRTNPQVSPSTQDTEKIMWSGGTLVCEITDGKLRHKIKTGKYEKFGVAVYPEVLEPSGLSGLVGDGVYSADLTGWTGEILVVAGKSPKVVKAEFNVG